MALFHAVATLADELAGEGSRLKKRAAIAEAIGRVHADSPGTADAGRFALYLAGLPFPEADPRKLNAGGALLTRAVLKVTGATDAALGQAYRRHGDLGAAAFDLLCELREGEPEKVPDLRLEEVSAAFATMASARTTAVRAGTVETLLRRATGIEAKYLLKLALGDMRIGVKQSLVEEAIAVAASKARNEDLLVEVAAVRHAVMLEADLGRAVERAFAGTLAEARMRLFHPLGFMLASPVETPEEAVARFTPKAAKPKTVPLARKRRKRDDAAERVAELAAEVDEAIGELAEGAAADGADSGGELGAVHALLEDKYDGMRAQIHCGDADQPGRVAIYSRNREDITENFPELAEAFAHVDAQRDGALVLDGEILAWDYAGETADGEAAARALPFAVLGTRIGRRKVTDEVRRQVPVVFVAFDLMAARGELVLDRPLRERRALLEEAVAGMVGRVVSPMAGPAKGEQAREAQGSMFAASSLPGGMAGEGLGPAVERLMLSAARVVETAGEIDRAYAEARARANEGVMLKSLVSVYQPGRRGLAWVKLKRQLATLDVVVTGAEYGSGRRAAFLSDYTFAVRGPEGELLNVGKAYSGVTDAEIAELTEFLKQHTLTDYGHFRTVEPLVVLEVAFNNVMRSDRHDSGFALRFPRILRIRGDKPLEEIDTLERVEEVYLSQVDRPVESMAVSGG